MEFYLHFSLTMGRSLGFGPNACNLYRPVQTRFRFGFIAEQLNLAAYIRSPDRSTKSTISHFDVLYVLVGTGFQVLFHSPPGVLFTFPSQYYSLSVTGEYLGLEGGPPGFPRGFTCPAVLWILPAVSVFRLRDSHALRSAFPYSSARLQHTLCSPQPRTHCCMRFGLFRFRSPLLTESRLISLPRPT